MDTDQVRDLLHDALTIFRHQRHAGSERIKGYHDHDDGFDLAFDDGSVATVTITMQEAQS